MLCEFIMLRCVPNDQTIIDNLEHASCRLILFSNGVSDVASANFGALSGSGYGLKRLKKKRERWTCYMSRCGKSAIELNM